MGQHEAGMARPPVVLDGLLVATKITLLVCAWACVGVFLAWQQASLIGTWTWLYHDPEGLWEKFRTTLDIKYKALAGHSTLYGWDNLNTIFNFMPVAAAAVCVAAAYALPRTPLSGKAASAGEYVWQPFKRCLNWQMPLRRWWLYWCGGLSLGEALVWSGWVVVHAVGLWDLVNYLFIDTKMAAWRAMSMRTHAPRSVLICEDISISFAWIIYIDLAVMFLPISKNSFLNRLLGIPYAGMIRFHRWVSHFTLWTVAGHGLFYYFLWIADPTINFWAAFFDWDKMYPLPSFAGTLAFASGIFIWATSVQWIRRNYYKFFYRCHIIGFILFTVFSFVHYYWSWYGFFPGLFLWAADLVVRSYYSQKGAHITAMARSADGSTLHIDISLAPKTFRDPMSLRGAHIYLRVPALSRLEWHPFTVADASVDAAGFTTLSLVIKSYGEWTKRLSHLGGELLGVKTGDPASSVMLPAGPISAASALHVNIWRPFDLSHIDLHRYSDVLLVAGGIAVTPAAALIRNTVADVRSGVAAAPRRMRLLFIARNKDEFAALGADIVHACQQYDWLDTQLYYTGPGAAADSTNSGGALKATDSDGLAAKVAAASSFPSKGMERSGSGSGNSGSDESPVSPLPHSGSIKIISDGGNSVGSRFWSLIKRWLPIDFLTDDQAIWIVLLAFFGGFMGIVMAQTFMIEYWAANGYFWGGMDVVGIVTVIVISVDCIGFPAFMVLLPIYVRNLYRWYRGTPVATPPLRSYPATPAAVVDAQGNRLVCLEADAALPIAIGRPDLRTAILDFAREAAAVGNAAAAVVSAGPSAMMAAVSLAVADNNGVACCGCATGEGGAYLDKHDVAFEF